MVNLIPAKQCVRKRLVRALAIFIMLTAACMQVGAQSHTTSVCSKNPYYFTKPGAISGTTYTWSAPVILPAATAITGGFTQTNPQSSVSEVLENTTTFQATATYTVYATNPNTSLTDTFRLVVTVNPLPELSSTPTPAAVCSGTTFNYLPTSTTPSSSFAWSRLAVPDVSNVGAQGGGNGNPAEILYNTSTAPVTVLYSYTVTANGCALGAQLVSVDVNPIPYLNSTLTPGAVCSGTTFNYVPSSPNANGFTWTRAAATGISNSAGASNGNPEVHEVLQNTTLLPRLVTYRYTLTNNTLTCSSNTQIVELVVLPVPVVTNQTLTASCNGNAFLSSPSNVPEGTYYTWTTPQPINSTAVITGGSSVNVGQLFISQELTNGGAATETMRYTVTPNWNGCVGSTFFVDVPVNTTGSSKAELSNPTPAPICSGGTFSFTPASTTATSYSWKRFYNSAINQSPGGTSNTGAILEQLTNNTTLQTTVYYAYTLITPNGCSNTQTLAVPVNPPTVLNSALTPVAVCSNTLFAYSPTSATPGTTFGWTRAGVTNISNSPDGAIGAVSEKLINTGTSPIPVVYRYSLNTPDGCTNAQNVIVVVNPTPKLTSTANPAAICSGNAFTYTPLSSTTGATFSWTRDAIPSISNAPGAGSGNSLSEVLVDSSIVAVSVVYKYTVSANACSNLETVNVVVNPTPRVGGQIVIACSKTLMELQSLNVPAGTTFGWAPPTINPVSSVVGANAITLTGQAKFSQLLTNQTLNPAFVSYTVTPVTNGCTGVSFKVDGTINPVPVIANQQLQAVCSGIGFSYSNGSVPTGTTYTWSSPVQTPLNSLTGSSAQSIAQSNISQLLSSTNNQINTAVYTVTPFSYGCEGQTFELNVPVNPTPAINSLTDTICSTGSFALAPTAPSNTTYSWGLPTSIPFGAVVGSSAQNNSSTISQSLINATNGTAQAVYNVIPTSGTCVGPSFNVTITVGVPLPFTPDQSSLICSGTSFDVTPVTSRAGTTYTWSVPTVTPVGSIVGATAMSTPQAQIKQTLDNLINKTDTVVYTVLPYSTGCRGNVFKAVVQVFALPKASITGSAVICRTPTDTVSVTFTGTAPWNFTYTNGTTTGTQTGITTSPYKWAVAAIPDLATRILSISEVKDLGCINTNNTGVFVQRVNALPIALMTSLHGIYICNNIQDTIMVQSLRASDVLTYQWTRNGSPIVNQIKDTLITSQAGRYNVTMTNQYGCIDTATAPIPVSVILQPVLKITLDSYCIDKQIQFTNLTDTTNIGATTWLWDFGDTTSSVLFNPTHTYARAGKHHLRLTAVQAFCAGYTTAADATLDVQTPITGVTMPSVSTYKGKITPLAVRTIAGYGYRWNPSRGIDKPDSASVNFDLSSTQQYAVSLISSGGCVTTDSLLVRVFDDKLQNIFVPKSFTPNNDGINDILYPYLSGIKEFKYFKVFNRFGKTVFETNNPDMGWNGSVNGVAQPMGIYLWYSIGVALDGTPVENKGQTLLIR